jgi:hypothetical protein
MTQRGRKSSAAIELAPVIGLPAPPPAPPELSPEEAELWDATVRSMRPGWFGPESLPLLSSYCLVAVMARAVAAELRKVDVGSPRFRGLSAQSCRLTTMLLRLSKALRLSPNSRRTKDSERDPRGPTTRPWEWRPRQG